MGEPSSLLTLKHELRQKLITVLTLSLAIALAIAVATGYAVGLPWAPLPLVAVLGYSLFLLFVPWLARHANCLPLLGWPLLAGLLLLLLLAAWTTGGLEAPVLIALPLLPVLGALLLHRRYVVPCLVAVIFSLLLLHYGQNQAWIAPLPLEHLAHVRLQFAMLLLSSFTAAGLSWYSAYHNDQLQEQLSGWAQTDGLTGVANRRHFDETLRLEWQRNQRTQTPVSLLLVDVDHFKQYNDTHGHLAGDHALQCIAQAIAARSRRSGEQVARYGGEEFAVILPNVDGMAAAAIAQQLRQEVAQLYRWGHSHLQEPVTVSVGLASTVPQADQSIESLIHQADRALYCAKQLGRNRVAGVPASAAIAPPGGHSRNEIEARS